MDEHVLTAVVRLDEAEALHVVVELDNAHGHGGSLSQLMQMHASEIARKRDLSSVCRCNWKESPIARLAMPKEKQPDCLAKSR